MGQKGAGHHNQQACCRPPTQGRQVVPLHVSYIGADIRHAPSNLYRMDVPGLSLQLLMCGPATILS